MNSFKIVIADIVFEFISKDKILEEFTEQFKLNRTDSKSDIVINLKVKNYGNIDIIDPMESVKLKRNNKNIIFSHIGIDGTLNIETLKADFTLDNRLYAYNYLIQFLLIYTSPFFDLFFIHASSVAIEEFGIVATGVSESGKSTLAKKLDNLGGEIFHEEMTLIRKVDNQFYIYSLPIGGYAYKLSNRERKKINYLLFLGKTKQNYITKLSKKEIYQNFFKVIFSYSDFENDYFEKILDLLDSMIKEINIVKLNFNPKTLTIDIFR